MKRLLMGKFTKSTRETIFSYTNADLTPLSLPLRCAHTIPEDNDLTGSIPTEFANYGDLVSLWLCKYCT